jgi:hypothetical protein
MFSTSSSHSQDIILENSDDSSSEGSSSSLLILLDDGAQFAQDFAEDFYQYQNTSFLYQLGGGLADSITPFKILWQYGGMEDVINTNWRTLQVYSNAVENGTHNDRQNNHSLFYKVTTPNGESTGLTDAGWTMFSLGLLGLPLGLAMEVYHNYRLRRVASLSFHKNRMKELYKNKGVDFDEANFDQNVKDTYARFYVKKKVVNRLAQENSYDYEDKNYVNDAYGTGATERFVRLFNGEFTLGEKNLLSDLTGSQYRQPEEKSERTAYELAIVFGSHFVKGLWNFINNAGFIYWLVWFPFVLAVGIGTASVSLFYSPLIIGITLSLALVYTVSNAIFEGVSIFKTKQQIQAERENSDQKAEDARISAELKYQHFKKMDHKLNKQYFQGLLQNGVNPIVPKEKKPQVEQGPRVVLHRTKAPVQNSALAKYLLQGSNELRALAITRDVVNAIIMVSFAFWILSATGVAVFGLTLPSLAFLDSMVLSGIVGLVVGGVFAGLKHFEIKDKQLAFEKLIHTKLCEESKVKGVTKLEYFEAMELRVEFKKAQAEWLRLKILLNAAVNAPASAQDLADSFENDLNIYEGRATTQEYQDQYRKLQAERQKLERKLQRAGTCPAADRLASNYDLDKEVDVYNHEYRDKQRHQAGLWTKTKRFFEAGFKFFCSVQTGSLLTRSLFIDYCVFGFVVAGLASVLGVASSGVLIGVAATIGVAYGAVCLSQFLIERKRKEKENFVNNMDNNNAYFDDKDKELSWMHSHLCAEAGVKNLPVIDPIVSPVELEKPKATVGLVNQPVLTQSKLKSDSLLNSIGHTLHGSLNGKATTIKGKKIDFTVNDDNANDKSVRLSSTI